ncbi:hypothetical protein OH492_10280 [Vibrio chagasii]|nr:hypothetical protein [Vibrio chagasii]
MEDLSFTADIVAIGHRIVHGGEVARQFVLLKK